MEYPLTVTDDAKVLLLYYAAVFEHCENPEGMWKPTPAQQPYINVRILDEDGNLLTECTKALSAAELDQGNKRGWEKFKWDATYHSMLKLHVPIIWFDWKTLGINLTDFVGQKVK